MKRTFRTGAVSSGWIARRFTGEEKSRRQVLFSTDLIYDVLRKHQADHVLLRAARADAATGLLDLKRLGDMLLRIKGRIIHKELVREGHITDRKSTRLNSRHTQIPYAVLRLE